jgi:hypothetical protein
LGSALQIVWLSEASPLRIDSAEVEELRVRDRSLVLHDWLGEDRALVELAALFGSGPARALVLRASAKSTQVLLVGEEGSALLHLDLAAELWREVAELPRFPNDIGGMCRIDVLQPGPVTLLHWELGILALGPSLDLLWRHDLEWNHSLVSLDDQEVWFDLMYESNEVAQRIGDSPWGFRLADGRELFDRNPPGS